MRSVIEGKRDHSSQNEGADHREVSPESDEAQSTQRSVYVLKGGKLVIQAAGVEQFEKSLEKRVKKMVAL